MSIFHWALVGLGIYVVIGIAVATIFMQTPYAENGWLIIFLLWPLFLFGR